MLHNIKTAIIAVLLLGITACSDGSSDYVGTWTKQQFLGGVVLVINSDGTGSFGGGMNGTRMINWKMQDKTILLNDPEDANAGISAKLASDKQSLILTIAGGREEILLRQDSKNN